MVPMTGATAQPASLLMGSPSEAAPNVRQGVNTTTTASNTISSLQNTTRMGKSRPCRFCATKNGCRAGSSCPFSHEDSPQSLVSGAQNGSSLPSTSVSDETLNNRSQAVRQTVPSSRVVARPVPKAQLEDPREFQLGQIRRRYKPKETKNADGAAVLDIKIVPSDPDFPFEMDLLLCNLIVPRNYPISRPSLIVKNQDIPRGFAINIENGFRGLSESSSSTSLLALMSALDKNLEVFLSAKKAETVILVANVDKRHLSHAPAAVLGSRLASGSSQSTTASAVVSVPELVQSKPGIVFSEAERFHAQERREAEIRQLEARLGRLPLFKKSGDGIAFTIPIEPRRPAELPAPLQTIKYFKLFVPLLYPLQNCRAQLEGINPVEAKPTETAFEEKAKKSREISLMGHVNNLAQNMHVMSKYVIKEDPTPQSPVIQPHENLMQTTLQDDLASTMSNPGHGLPNDDRTHIRVISRPPEWDLIDSEEDSDSDDYTYDSGDESSDKDSGGIELSAEEAAAAKPGNSLNQQKGTSLSFPFVELYGIELLELFSLNLSVKCERCKEQTDIHGLKDNLNRTESCRKCAVQLSVTFRRDLIHANAVRAGFLDLSGCTPVDMLPSSLIPTCSRCSTPYPQPGVVSVRGETTSNVCRECHQKFTFKIPEIKFLRISTTHLPPAIGPRRKKEVLGLVPGTELPRRGRCKHYSKSLRWFRFSCCQKVYPCDRCHDEAEEHINEHANRMLCGLCSREQNYRPEDCGVCHAGLVGKKGTGFWEGGKGTRDRVRMSRKDKRKFRRPGGAAQSATKASKENKENKGGAK